LIPTLVGFGVPHSQAILAVLAYRLVNFWIPIPSAALLRQPAVARKRVDLRQRPGSIHRQTFELGLGGEVIDRLQAPPTAVGAEHPGEEVVAPGDLEGLEQFGLQRAISMGTRTSTRRSRLRSIRSAEPM
jgi:hypothetical protein